MHIEKGIQAYIVCPLIEEDEKEQLNSVERNLTVDKLESVCKKYSSELGIPTDPDFLALEYYG